MASLFLTPSGNSAVLLLEDKARKSRCNSLEAQYYRAILDSDWGKTHLQGNLGKYWVGGGCREVTLALSNEVLHLHGGNLARQVRKMVAHEEARICIWDYQEDNGALIAHSVEAFKAESAPIGEWHVVWDEGFINEAKKLRKDDLPSETGGILLGIVDYQDRTITLVKACTAPPASEQTATSFTWAGYESPKFIKDCMQRTAEIVTYVGEWHSHPEGVAPLPSNDDIRQHAFVHQSLAQEGQPAMMMIVSETLCGFYVDGFGASIDTGAR